jgi:tetratricopeptide (TPR) repeat protein
MAPDHSGVGDDGTLLLKKELRGDLQWIVARATEKIPSSRYSSIEALIDDLERYLSHRPIQAGPRSITYRARKFARRHRVGLATSATVFAALVVGAALSASGYLKAIDERAKRLQQQEISTLEKRVADERRAEAEADAARQAELVGSAQNAMRTLIVPVKGETVERSIKRLDELAERIGLMEEEPDETLAPLESTLAFAYQSHRESAKAQIHAKKAIAMLERLGPEYRESLGMTMTILGTSLAAQGLYDEANVWYRRAVEIFRETDPVLDSGRLPNAFLNLAISQLRVGNDQEAKDMIRSAMGAAGDRAEQGRIIRHFMGVLRNLGRDEDLSDYTALERSLPVGEDEVVDRPIEP